jgi:hypothetical protein
MKHFSNGFEGVFMGLIMGGQNIMGSDYGSNISGSVICNDKANNIDILTYIS